MRHNRIEIYIHLIWSPWDRQPLILPSIERRLYRCLQSEAQSLKCEVLALGGTQDHVHSLLSFPATAYVSEVVKQMKGNSSLLANKELELPFDFKWSGAYAAFSVSRWDKSNLVTYIENQKQHHANGTTTPSLELPPEEKLTPDEA